jgi:hypothetical protein
LFGIYAGWYRFIVFWTLFSAVNGFGKREKWNKQSGLDINVLISALQGD